MPHVYGFLGSRACLYIPLLFIRKELWYFTNYLNESIVGILLEQVRFQIGTEIRNEAITEERFDE